MKKDHLSTTKFYENYFKMKQKINFITYGDSKKYEISKKHILNLAKHSGFFNQCLGMSEKDINVKFKNSFEKILSEKRGGGYYIWKIPIIDAREP